MQSYRGVPSGEEDGEGWREIDVLISERDEDTPTCPPELPVEHGVEDGVVVLHVLHQEGVAESQRTLKVLTECIIQETTKTVGHSI